MSKVDVDPYREYCNVTVELLLPHGIVCFTATELAIPEGSNVKKVSGLRLSWISHASEEHTHDSRMYGIGMSTVPLIFCPKLSFSSRLTFTKLIMGIRLRKVFSKTTLSYGDVAMSFPYANAELLISCRALKRDDGDGTPIDLLIIDSQYVSIVLHSR